MSGEATIKRTRRVGMQLLLLVLSLAIVCYRFWFLHDPFIELDAGLYLRASADYARHFAAGDWLRTPVSSEQYAAVEYWPPLYPALCGFVSQYVESTLRAAQLVSWLAGMMVLPPVYCLMRRFWDGTHALVAVALVGFWPPLAWYGSVPRSESLYTLLLVSAIACVLTTARGTSGASLLITMAGGICCALAYLTRFEGVVLLPLLLVAQALLLRSTTGGYRRAVVLALALISGFAIASAPYLWFLASLNGWHFTLTTPQKQAYDLLEGIWLTVLQRSHVDFTFAWGLPGQGGVVPSDPTVQGLLREHAATFWANAPRLLPGTLPAMAFNVWSPAVALFAIISAWRGRRESRVQSIALFFVMAAPVAVASFWDASPRYYAFLGILTPVLATPSIVAFWRREWQLPAGAARWAPLVLSGLIFAAWHVPAPSHFDSDMMVDSCQFLLVPGAARLYWQTLAIALSTRLTLQVAGCRASTQAAVTGLVALLCVLLQVELDRRDFSLFVWYIPLSLTAFAACLGLACLPLALPRLGPTHASARLMRWAAVWMAVVALQDAAAFKQTDAAFSRQTGTPAAYEMLVGAGRPPAQAIVLSMYAWDPMRAGYDWAPLRSEAMLAALQTDRPVYVIMGTSRPPPEMAGASAAESWSVVDGRPLQPDIAQCDLHWVLYRVR